MADETELTIAFRGAFEDILDESPLAPDWDRATGQVIYLTTIDKGQRSVFARTVLAAAVVVVAATIGVLTVIPGSPDGVSTPVVGSTVTTIDVASTSVAVAPAPPIPEAATPDPLAIPMTWTRLDDAEVFTESAMWAVAADGSRVVAGGMVIDPETWITGGGESSAALWVSADGTEWDRVDESMLFADGERRTMSLVRDIVAGPLGFLAVGRADWDAAAWTSPDGVTWTRVTDENLRGEGGADGIQDLIRATAGGPGWVAVGEDDTDALVLVSSDGIEWDQIDDADLLDAGMMDVVQTQSGLVAVGDWAPPGQAGVWVSEDGFDWERLPADALPMEEGIESLTASPEGDLTIAFGWEAIWRSNDGVQWTGTPRPQSLAGPAPWSGVAWDDDRLIAAGRGWWHSMWVSLDDGLNWRRVQPDGEVFRDRDQTFDVVVFGSRIMAVGEALKATGEISSSAVWIGEWTDR